MLGAAVLLHAGAQPSILPSPWDYLGWGRSLGPIVAPMGSGGRAVVGLSTKWLGKQPAHEVTRRPCCGYPPGPKVAFGGVVYGG